MNYFSTSDLHRTLCVLLAIFLVAGQQKQVLAQTLSPASDAGAANSELDVDPPVIELEEITLGTAGETQVFTVLVADDQLLKDVKLYYRFAGQVPFRSIFMNPLGASGYFTASVGTSIDESRAIEYYIQARDLGGNRSVKGFAFEPLIRELRTPETEPVAADPVDTPRTVAATESTVIVTNEPAIKEPEAENSGIKWWQIALAVLAVGALAGAAGGGSGGGSGGGTGIDNGGDGGDTGDGTPVDPTPTDPTVVPLTLTITLP